MLKAYVGIDLRRGFRKMSLTRIIYWHGELEEKSKKGKEIPSLDVTCSGVDSKILGGGRDPSLKRVLFSTFGGEVEILCAFKDLVGVRDEIRLNSLSNFLASFLKSESRRVICLSKSVF